MTPEERRALLEILLLIIGTMTMLSSFILIRGNHYVYAAICLVFGFIIIAFSSKEQ